MDGAEPRTEKSGTLELVIEAMPPRVRIELRGELDFATVDLLAKEIHDAEETDAEEIVLDLSGLEFMDSTGLHCLLQAHQRSTADSSRFEVHNARDAVARLFKLTGLDQVFVGEVSRRLEE
jgi:anti-anti-sigma factor